jgi:hypothetical protein
MNSLNDVNSSDCMNSHTDMNSSGYMNSHSDVNSSEFMNSHNDKNSSDYENSYVPLCVFVPDKELYCLTDSHIKLNTLDDLQECLSNIHQKIAFNCDEDTVILVEESTLATLVVSLSNNSNPSAGNASVAFEYKCYEIEAGVP